MNHAVAQRGCIPPAPARVLTHPHNDKRTTRLLYPLFSLFSSGNGRELLLLSCCVGDYDPHGTILFFLTGDRPPGPEVFAPAQATRPVRKNEKGEMSTMAQKTIPFASAFMFPWIKSSIGVEGRMVKLHKANTILGVIPAGAENQTIPLDQVSVSYNSKINIKAMLLGLILAGAGIFCFGINVLLGLVLLILGAGNIGSGIITEIEFQRNGNPYVLTAACYAKKAVAEAVAMVNQASADVQEGKDTRVGAQISGQMAADASQKTTDAIAALAAQLAQQQAQSAKPEDKKPE